MSLRQKAAFSLIISGMILASTFSTLPGQSGRRSDGGGKDFGRQSDHVQ